MDEARKFITRASSRMPNEASLYNALGNILARSQKFPQAIGAYQQALSLSPDYPGALNNLGNCYCQINEFDKAQTAYRQAIDLDPDYPDARFNLARILVAEGDKTRALQQLEYAVKVAPRHAGIQGLLGNLYLEDNRAEEAIQHLQQRIDIQPQHAETYLALAGAYFQLQQFPAAELSLERALDCAPKLPLANHLLATVYLQQNQLQWALQHYLRELELNPNHLDSLYNAGVVYADKQHVKEAEQHFQQVLKLNPNHVPSHLNLGALYLKQNAVAKAIEQYRCVQELEPENKEIEHILHALLQDELPAVAPKEYVTHLFDQYASHYDQHLGEILQYSVPAALFHLVNTIINPTDSSLTIVDLGCGTGLGAVPFKNQAKKLIGIDLSPNMLAVAKTKNLYQELIHAGLSEGLNKLQDVDLIIAADVFPYLGDLKNIFAACQQALKPGGHLAFSVEKLSENNSSYQLLQTIRYAHSKNYLETLSSNYGFEILGLDNIILRKQRETTIEGYAFLLKKPD